MKILLISANVATSPYPIYPITIAYDGTDYAGWQVQPRKNTVQAEIERVIEHLVGKKIRIHHSGRTDAGVHAKGQVAHFDLDKAIEAGSFHEQPQCAPEA